MSISQPVVTIFETYGSGASEVGPAVARALGVPWISQVYSSEDLEAAEEQGDRRDSFLERILGSLGRTTVASDQGASTGPLDALDAADRERALRALVTGGGVVLGRNATVILADEPLALHVKLDGPLDQRIARGARLAGIDLAHAATRQAREDAARTAMCQRLFRWDPRRNDHFDLVINTGLLPLDRVVELILAAHRLKVGG